MKLVGEDETMKQLIVCMIALMVCFPCSGFAEPPEIEQENFVEINKLAQTIAEKNYAPLKVVVEGENMEDALVRAAFIVRNHIGLEEMSPILCRCTDNIKFVPAEECQYLKSLEHAVMKTDGSDTGVKLVMHLDEDKLKQLAYFRLWPLHRKHFVSRPSA